MKNFLAVILVVIAMTVAPTLVSADQGDECSFDTQCGPKGKCVGPFGRKICVDEW